MPQHEPETNISEKHFLNQGYIPLIYRTLEQSNSLFLAPVLCGGSIIGRLGLEEDRLGEHIHTSSASAKLDNLSARMQEYGDYNISILGQKGPAQTVPKEMNTTF